MANASSSTVAVAALMQKASQQYLECRRRVTAKSDEVSKLDSELQSLFERITASSTSTARGAKSVGRLELSIVAVEGDAPVEDAVITVEIDPEYEEPEAPVVETKTEEVKEEEKTTEEVKEAEAQEETEEAKEEAAETAEEATEEEEKKTEETAETEEDKTEEATEEEAEKPEETTEEEAEKAEEAAVEKEETPVAQRRSVAWSDADSLPLSLVFDPVQSREAVVTISIAAPAEDGEESEPVKEFRIPVSSLFQTGSVNRWYVIKKVEHIHTDKAAITEVADEDEPTPVADAEEPVKEEKEEECSAEEPAEKTEETETPAATEGESAADETEKAEEGDEPKAEEEVEEPKTEETVAAAPHQTLVEATATVQSEDTVVVLKEGKLHVQVHFTMSEIEKLSQMAIAVSQQKQEADAMLAALEREAASLRTKYERLSASQRSMSTGAGGVVKPRSTLLGGRGLGGAAGLAAAPRVEKSSFQKIKDSVAATLTPQRTQVLTSFAIFVGSVALFHFQGDNLLA